jgi:hypothetical protein
MDKTLFAELVAVPRVVGLAVSHAQRGESRRPMAAAERGLAEPRRSIARIDKDEVAGELGQ